MMRRVDQEGGAVVGTGVGRRNMAAGGVEQALAEAQRVALRAEARREAAKRELDQARTDLQAARRELWAAVRVAREEGLTYPQIAAALGVTVQRAHALAGKPPEPARR